MRISDWGSDVCSSDLTRHALAVDARHTGNLRHPRASADPATSRAAPKTPAPACACKTIRSGSPDPSSDPQQRIRQGPRDAAANERSEEHTSELQSLMRRSSAVFRVKTKSIQQTPKTT